MAYRIALYFLHTNHLCKCLVASLCYKENKQEKLSYLQLPEVNQNPICAWFTHHRIAIASRISIFKSNKKNNEKEGTIPVLESSS